MEASSGKEGRWMRVIYVDVLFLMNFSADFIILSLTARLLRRDAMKLRLLIAAFFGGIYAVLATLFISGIPSGICAALALALMVLFAFGYRNFSRYLRSCLAVLLLSALFGGVITLVWSYLRDYLGKSELRADTGAKLVFFLFLSVFGYLLVRFAARLSGLGEERSVRVRVTVGGTKRALELLVDNACFLREPLTGKAVIVLSRKSASGLLPESILAAGEGELPDLSGEQRRRYYAIVCKTVGGRRIMHGYRPDKVELFHVGKHRELSALIGLSNVGEESFRGCDGIIPSGIVKS
jgi:stage II sporulation protein GA (sporulation sigma-E factor processing peptidase)